MTGTMAMGGVVTPPSVSQVLKQSRQALAVAGIESAEREAAWLLEAVVHMTPLRLRIEGDRLLTPTQVVAFERLISRRAAREPLQYILGTQEFCGLDFEVSPAVLIPRPESELLVQEAEPVLLADHVNVIVDIGTGSGCLAVSLASLMPNAKVYAVDCSPKALVMASRNMKRHGVDGQMTCLHGDLCLPLEAVGLAGRVNVMVANLPYVTEEEWGNLQPEIVDFEPRVALVGGVYGTEILHRLLLQSWRYLAPSGWLLLEVGKGQAETVCRLAAEINRYTCPTVRKDMAGIDRVVRMQSLGH